jgi:hypothetical protein
VRAGSAAAIAGPIIAKTSDRRYCPTALELHHSAEIQRLNPLDLLGMLARSYPIYISCCITTMHRGIQAPAATRASSFHLKVETMIVLYIVPNYVLPLKPSIAAPPFKGRHVDHHLLSRVYADPCCYTLCCPCQLLCCRLPHADEIPVRRGRPEPRSTEYPGSGTTSLWAHYGSASTGRHPK